VGANRKNQESGKNRLNSRRKGKGSSEAGLGKKGKYQQRRSFREFPNGDKVKPEGGGGGEEVVRLIAQSGGGESL